MPTPRKAKGAPVPKCTKLTLRRAFAAPKHAEKAIALTMVLIATGVLFLETKDYALLGWDSYPAIVTSSVRSFSDFIKNFTEELLDGRREFKMYRPLLNLSFALDHALWGLEPFGYQLTNALLFACSAGSLYVLVRRASGAGASVAPLAALTFFLIHPVHVEVLPVPPRRPEMLCCMFMSLSLALQLSPRALGMRTPPVVPALFALLAIASKETGMMLPVLSFGAVLLYSPREGLPARVRHAATAVVPHLVVLLGALAARMAILGGMGGHLSTQISETVNRFPYSASRMVARLAFPQPLMQKSLEGKLVFVVVALGLALTGTLTVLLGQRSTVARASQRRLVRTAVIAVAWLVLMGLTYAASIRIAPWYVLLPAAASAMLVGALADGLVGAIRRGRLPTRIAATPTLLLLAGLVIWQGCYSPLVNSYGEWHRATLASRSFLRELRCQIRSASDGSVLEAPPIPTQVQPNDDRPCIQGAHVLCAYSVQAWAELVFPRRRIRVLEAKDASGEEPHADEVLVVVTNRMDGF